MGARTRDNEVLSLVICYVFSALKDLFIYIILINSGKRF